MEKVDIVGKVDAVTKMFPVPSSILVSNLLPPSSAE